MKNVFWCLDGFIHCRLLLSYRFNCSDGSKLSSYEELSQVEFDLQLQTDDKLSLYGHYKPCQKLMSNSL